MNITQVGIDLAKLVFQVHGVDSRGKVGLRRQLKRSQVAVFFAQLVIVGAPALRATLGGGLPALSQYLLDPRDAEGVMGTESLQHLVRGDFRMALPDRTNADSGRSVPIELPRHPSPARRRVLP